MSRVRGLLSVAGHGLRSLAYLLQDLLFLALRAPRAAGRGLGAAWMRLSLKTRQRVALGLLAAALAAAFIAFVVPALPCQFPGGKVCAPDDDSGLIVPADALGYAHLTLDPGVPQYEDATEALDAVPRLTEELVGRLLAQVPGPGGEPADFERDIAPWLGGQAAVAIVPGGGAAEQVQLLEEGDPAGAAEFALALAAGTPRAEEYRGIEVSIDSRGLATASVGGFLVIGTDDGVRRIIDVETGAEGVRPLAEDPVASRLIDELPAERFAEAYVSPDGIEGLVASQQSRLASLEPFVDAGASEGAAASVGFEEGSLEVAIRSSLDPERSESEPGFFAAFPSFRPELPDRLAEDSLAYAGIGDPGTTVAELLEQATAQAPALGASLTDAFESLRESGEIDIEDELLPALGGEAAFALQPGEEDGGAPAPEPGGEATAPVPVPEGLPQGPAPVIAGEAPVPALQFVAGGVDSERARRTLAQLQGPIAGAFDAATGLQAPVFNRQRFQGVDIQILRVSPTVNLSYAIAGESLAVATQPAGVEQVIAAEGGLGDSDAYEEATADFPEQPSLIAFLNIAGLVALGEREALGENPAYAPYAPDIRRLDAAGIAVDSSETSLATDLRVVIDQSGDAEDAPSGD